jgi:outer membrane protein OmpA-like peptidoglycan-associated protein
MNIHILLFLLFFFQNSFTQNKSNKYELIKLPINTALSEIATQVRGDYLYVYRNKPFYRVRSEYYDLYKINVNKEEVLSRFTKLDNDLNTRFNEGPVSFDDENKKVYVTRNVYTKKEMITKDLSENPLEIDIYEEVNDTFIFKRKFKYNDKNISIGHASYSELTHRLYFSANMKDSRGGADLYFCEVLSNGDYGPVVNLGKKINTKKDELFTMANNGVLFFSTSGFNKRETENLDIFYIREIDIARKREPKKLDFPFNSKQDDFGITFIDGQQGYLTSNRNNSRDYNHDIYYFNLGNPIIGDDEFDLELTIKGENKTKLRYNNFKIIDKKTKQELKKTIVNGNVLIEQPKENNLYQVLFDESLNFKNAEIGPYTRIKREILLSDILELENKDIPIEITKDTIVLLSLEQINKDSILPSSFALNDIYFEYSEFKVSDKSSEILNSLANYLSSHKKLKLKIYAHTDSRGNDQYNLTLSNKRANSVFLFLVSKGITSKRIIECKGLGETQLLEECIKCSKEQHQKNRRVEFILSN